MEKVVLHPLERKVLAALRGRGWVDFDSLVAASGLLPDQVRRSISWLSSKGLISMRESVSHPIKATGYPVELLLVQRVPPGTTIPLQQLRATFKSDDEFGAAIGRASRNRWIEVISSERGQLVSSKNVQGSVEAESFVQSLTAEDLIEEELPESRRRYLADLIKRNLVSRKERRFQEFSATDSGIRELVLKENNNDDDDEPAVEKLTPEIISSGRWKTVRLRPIDVEAPSRGFYPGRRHPVKEFINEVREVYLSMGFEEVVGSSIQSAFWNFDALFTPQDHPARELQDTFYIRNGLDEGLERKGVVDKVASTHEDGWKTGSMGWHYKWSIEEARRLVLRTHNTAITIQATARSGNEETRVFSVARVYRNESLDYKHLAELHQMEGIIIGEGLNIRHLKGVLSEFYSKLGMSGVKLWPSFFPYTEPSMQVMTYSEKAGKWLEMGGSGIFRPEVTLPLGVTKPVIAWGCGLERLLMLRLGITDIRELYDNDIGWLRRRPEIASSQDIPQ